MQSIFLALLCLLVSVCAFHHDIQQGTGAPIYFDPLADTPRYAPIYEATLEIYYEWRANVTCAKIDFVYYNYLYPSKAVECWIMKWINNEWYPVTVFGQPSHFTFPMWYHNLTRYFWDINEVANISLSCCAEYDWRCEYIANLNDGTYYWNNKRNAVQLTIPPLTGRRVDETTAFVSWPGHHTVNWFETESYELQWSTSDTFASPSSTTISIPAQLRHYDGPNLPSEYQSAIVTGLTTGSTYYFRVRAVNWIWPSDWSNTLSLVIGGAPATPVSLSSVVTSSSTATVSWSSGSTNGGSITAWDVLCGNDNLVQTGLVGWYGIAATPLSKSVTLPLLGETYYCQVRATNEYGTSAWSTPTSFDLVWVPEAPTNVAVAPLTTTSVVVNWENPEEVLEQEDSTLQYSTSSSFSSVTSQSVAGAGTVAFVSYLTPASTYYFRVRASSVAGDSAWSDTVSFTLPNAPAFTPFTTFVADATTTSESLGSHSLLPNTLGNKEFSIYGSALTTFGSLKVSLESADSSISYELQVLHANATYCHGIIPAGVGANLHFRAVSGIASSALSDDTVSFPAPTITSGTLRRPGGSHQNPLPALTTLGEVLIFDGANFGTDVSKVLVQYGPTATPTLYTAEVKSLLDTQITVLTQTSASGTRNNLFTVTVGGQSVTGSDIYNYAAAPSISSVTGCSSTAGSGTTGCSTAGGTTITVTGTGFTESLFVTVGGLLCSDLSVTSPTSATCTLPSQGAGTKAVVAIQDDHFSTPVNYVTYA